MNNLYQGKMKGRTEWVMERGRRESRPPGFVYTSKKSPAAIEKSPNVGRVQGSTSGMVTLVSWLSYDHMLEN